MPPGPGARARRSRRRSSPPPIEHSSPRACLGTPTPASVGSRRPSVRSTACAVPGRSCLGGGGGRSVVRRLIDSVYPRPQGHSRRLRWIDDGVRARGITGESEAVGSVLPTWPPRVRDLSNGRRGSLPVSVVQPEVRRGCHAARRRPALPGLRRAIGIEGQEHPRKARSRRRRAPRRAARRTARASGWPEACELISPTERRPGRGGILYLKRLVAQADHPRPGRTLPEPRRSERDDGARHLPWHGSCRRHAGTRPLAPAGELAADRGTGRLRARRRPRRGRHRELPTLCRWPVALILLTQIGRSAPPHRRLEREVAALCPRAAPAWDGLTLDLG